MLFLRSFRLSLATTALLAAMLYSDTQAADKKVLMIAGPPSHGPGAHEHNAGILLLQKCLHGMPGLKTEIALNGWPKNPSAFDGVDAVLIYSDGGVKHVALQDSNLEALRRALAKGAGLGLLHYAVEPTLEKGQQEFLQWVGGAFEINWSVNPHWNANFKTLPRHPVTRGVKPFTILDEWYFNMRFVEGMKGVTPLLVATPDASTTSRPDGHHSGNPHVRALVAKGEPVVVSWGFERPDGGRGFGFCGGHFHENWGNDDFRKLVLNAIVWLAKMEVPANGVASKVTAEDLKKNLDPKPGKKTGGERKK
ncbi:MAG: ThuA domain-containing protein [Opitutaceae bacterium]|nr:ThuA domain-containing protein [Opitutaceae bacterium]